VPTANITLKYKIINHGRATMKGQLLLKRIFGNLDGYLRNQFGMDLFEILTQGGEMYLPSIGILNFWIR